MKKKSLMYESLTRFIICVAILLALATPLFYLLTKNFYAEDMIDIIEAVQQGKPVPAIDLEEDILHGIVIQFMLIVTILGVAIVLTMRLISKRLWLPFDKTLTAIEAFKLENGTIPALPNSGIKEFSRLNTVLNKLMADSLNSYRTQKEFTENASHELQTPLAVFQSKLDILLQQPGITGEQAAIIQDLYQMNNRLSRLSLSQGLTLQKDFQIKSLTVKANRSLLEIMLNNLIVNAVRHNKPNGAITVTVKADSLTVSNTFDETALDENLIFDRFYRPSDKSQGNGLGLAIVKAVCEYHGWKITYSYHDKLHGFVVTFR